MKRLLLCTAAGVLCITNICLAGTHHRFSGFSITQHNPAAGSSTVLNLIKASPELMYFESASDLQYVEFISHNDYASYIKEIIDGGIDGGAADELNIISEKSLHFAGDAPGTMIINSFNGIDHVFDPLLSNYMYLMFDVANIGNSAVNILPRVGPNSMYSSSSMYYGFDQYLNPVNARTLNAGDSATFVFGLGLDLSIADDVIWDYANGPHTRFELLFQPAEGVQFDVMVDNIGFRTWSAVPEPGIMALFATGMIICKASLKKHTNRKQN